MHDFSKSRTTQTPTDHDPWVPLCDWPRSWPSPGALRMRISRMLAAGVEVPFMRRVGRRVLVSPARWDAWIDGHAERCARCGRADCRRESTVCGTRREIAPCGAQS